MIILKILLGLLVLGIVVILIKLAIAVIATAIGVSLFSGMVCGVCYLLGWMEGDTVFAVMKWAFVVGIPLGIVYVICNPSEAINDGPSSSSKSSSEPKEYVTLKDKYGNYIEGEVDCDILNGNDGKSYKRDMYGDWHELG